MLLDDRNREHQRAEDEEDRVVHESVGDFGGPRDSEEDLRHRDQERDRGQRDRLGDEQNHGYARDHERLPAVNAQVGRKGQQERQRAGAKGVEEPPVLNRPVQEGSHCGFELRSKYESPRSRSASSERCSSSCALPSCSSLASAETQIGGAMSTSIRLK